MRGMLRNKRAVWYANQTSVTEILEDNLHTGRYTTAYANPTKIRINVLPAKGGTQMRPFGNEPYYDRLAVIAAKSTAITEQSVMWVDVTPVIDEDTGATTTPPDYVVDKVSKSINEVTLSLKRVDVT